MRRLLSGWLAITAVIVVLGGVAITAILRGAKPAAPFQNRESAGSAQSRPAAPNPATSTDPPRDLAGPPRAPLFRDVAGQLGIAFQYYNDAHSGRYFNAETNGGGVAWLDADGDGYQDLFFTNGCRLPYDPADRTQRDAWFRNVRGARFDEQTDAARLGDNAFGHGVSAGDLDNDGWPDLYIVNFQSTTAYRNNGDGTFTDVTDAAALRSRFWGSSAAFGDLDRDGDLDLYLSTYARADLNQVPRCQSATYPVYCGPDRYEADPHVFLLNRGDGTFYDATADCGFFKVTGKGMGVVIANLDEDEWPDVFVANDKTPSYLFHNESSESPPGLPRMRERGVPAGVAFNGQGDLVAGMGVACGDVDDDGRLDLFVTHYEREMDTLYRNLGRLVFSDDTAAAGLGLTSLPYLGFGTEFLDYDNDGLLDLVVSNGHVLGAAHWSYAMRPQLYRNVGGKFVEMRGAAGPYFQEEFVGRGLAIADFDNDGGIDFASTHIDRAASLVQNSIAERGHYARLRLVGRSSNRSAVNVRVVAQVAGRRQMRECVGGGSYQSCSDARIHIGLGAADRIDTLEVRWPSGQVDRWADLAGDQEWTLIERLSPRSSLAADPR